MLLGHPICGTAWYCVVSLTHSCHGNSDFVGLGDDNAVYDEFSTVCECDAVFGSSAAFQFWTGQLPQKFRTMSDWGGFGGIWAESLLPRLVLNDFAMPP